MNVLFVLECAGLMTNGTTASCVRFANELNKRGHKITVLGCMPKSGDFPTENYVVAADYKVPVFDGLVHKDGFQFVKVDDKQLYELIKEVDVVHFFLPFKLASHARLIADALGVAVTGAFHLQPDSITSAIHMSNRFINGCIYKAFKKYIYRRMDLVHCPSKMIKDKLLSYNYKNDLRVISNGISDFWHKVEATKDEKYKDKFVVTMVGRLSDEKRQDILIKAIKYSKHEKDIQLVLCGKGPNQHKYEKMFKKMKFTNSPEIKFLSQEDLRKFLSSADLYVHCSDAEIEGLSCVEAFTCGLVPVISSSPLSATHTFALCDESIFKHGKYKDLAAKIDYWFENPEKIKEYSLKYIEESKEYALPLQVDKFEVFFNDAIELKKNKKDVASQTKTRKDRRNQKKIFKKLLKQGVISEMPKI